MNRSGHPDDKYTQDDMRAPSPTEDDQTLCSTNGSDPYDSSSQSSRSSSSDVSSSSVVAYHPPNLAQLSAMIRSPTRGFYIGSLASYSTGDVDMLGVIARVIARPNPIINLGPVDHSCSFVVVDPHTPDHEIVYCSPTFCQLTQYSPDDILRKNCRFLQSPKGSVERGSTREYTDHQAVKLFKEATIYHHECQAALVNYKKSGEPFVNLVTIVPITWDSDKVRYHVGFQADLVEAPRQLIENVRVGRYTNAVPMRW